MKKPIIRIYKNSLFNHPAIKFIIHPEQEILKKHNIDGATIKSLYHYGGATMLFEDRPPMVWLPSISHPSLAHESLHVAFEILRYCGIEPQEELLAYLLGDIIAQVLGEK